MREWIMEQGAVIYIFAGILAIGLIGTFIANRGYKRLINEADAMGTSDNRLIKYIKLKFESYYKLGMEPWNADVLANRYIYKYKIGFMSLDKWEKIGKLTMVATALTVVIDGLIKLNNQADYADIWMMSGIGAISFLLLFGQYKIHDFGAKKQILRCVILDYLENFLKNKLGPGKELAKTRSKIHDNKKAMDEAAATHVRPKQAREEEPFRRKAEISSDDEIDAKVVEDILKEFLN